MDWVKPDVMISISCDAIKWNGLVASRRENVGGGTLEPKIAADIASQKDAEYRSISGVMGRKSHFKYPRCRMCSNVERVVEEEDGE